jgi:CelD/BcsL family acetyltransferase involved in cellulose biosynthesis
MLTRPAPEPSARRPAGWEPEIHRSIEAVADDWDRLADRVGAPPYLRPGWFTAWWAAFGRGTLEVLVLRRDGALAAVLPMARHLGTLRSLSNWHTPAFAPVAEPDAERPLAMLLLDRPVRRVTLAFVDPRGSFVGACTDVAAAMARRSLVRIVEQSPFLPVVGSWEAYERARLAPRHRRVLRARERQLTRFGPLAVEVVDGRTELERHLEEGFAVEARSWKGASGTAINSRPETREFYTEVARWAADRGDLRLASLRIGDRAIAFDLALEADGAHYLLKTGYDQDYRRFGPGSMLRAAMVGRAFAKGMEVYEFLGSDAAWKREWTHQQHDRAAVQLFARTPSGRLDRATCAHVLPLARRALAVARR